MIELRPPMARFDHDEAEDPATEHNFRLTFQFGEYATVRDVSIGGDCVGFANLEAAVMNLCEELPVNGCGDPYLVLRNPAGEEFVVEERLDGVGEINEDTLMQFLVSAEITGLVPSPNAALQPGGG